MAKEAICRLTRDQEPKTISSMTTRNDKSTIPVAMATVAMLAAPLHPQARGGAGPSPAAPHQTRTIFENTTVIDGTGAPARPGMAIVVEGDAITAIVPVQDLGEDIREGAEIVDASAWFAIPGLIESHTHLATVANRDRAEFLLNRQLYGGITTARDMAGDARALLELQRASLVKEIPAPDLHFAALMAGPEFFTDRRTATSAAGETPGAVPWMQAVTPDTDLREAVTLARGTWATGIKTYAAIEGDLLAAIAAEATRQGMPVWSHVHVGPARSLEVARAGVRAMSHVCDIGSAAIPDDVFREGQEGRRSGFVDVDLDHPAVDSVFAAMRQSGTVLDATLRITLRVTRAFATGIDSVRAARDSARALPPGAAGDSTRAGRPRDAGDSPGARPDDPRPTPIDRRRRGVRAMCSTEDAMDLTRRAYEAGVMIAAGTDGMTPPDSVFPALHEEIRHLHEGAGLPMMEVLKAATYHGAVALGLEDSIGTLEPGKHANIVFLRGDPMAGPASFRSVELTVKRGTLYYRKDFVLGAMARDPVER